MNNRHRQIRHAALWQARRELRRMGMHLDDSSCVLKIGRLLRAIGHVFESAANGLRELANVLGGQAHEG